MLRLADLARLGEIARAYRCGPRLDSCIEIIEEGDRYTILMDPCGSGGRMRWGTPGTVCRRGLARHMTSARRREHMTGAGIRRTFLITASTAS